MVSLILAGVDACTDPSLSLAAASDTQVDKQTWTTYVCNKSVPPNISTQLHGLINDSRISWQWMQPSADTNRTVDCMSINKQWRWLANKP